MLIKKERKIFKYLKLILLICFFSLAIFYRSLFLSYFLMVSNYFYGKNTETDLNTTEREELDMLRLENKTLRSENEKVRNEFSVSDFEEAKTPVFMLLGESSFYGNFFVSLPKNITAYNGMNVFSTGNVVVGQVEEILPDALKISKLGQGKPFIANSLENEESIELNSLGSGLYFGTVSGGSTISVGDTIVMKGYPKAIVGTVVEITKGETSLSNIFVRTPYNINNKEVFYVIR